MCRWMAYSGNPVPIEELLYKPKQNLIDQSLSSRSPDTPTNGDGFGIGWYGDLERPGMFHSIRPAWNDFNLRDLASQVKSHLFLAHVRATSLATVQETNCHPFRYGNWLFVHNGEIFQVEKLRRDLVLGAAPQYFENILGTTDSEVMFHLALTFGLESDPPKALARMAGFIEKVAHDHGVPQPLWMTVGVTDGKILYAVRYASDNDAPTLFKSPDFQAVERLNPRVAKLFGNAAHVIISEPAGNYPELWPEIPQASLVIIRGGDIETRPFRPET